MLMLHIGFSSQISTWEPSSCLPSSGISDFENGVQRDLAESVFSSGGQTVHSVYSQATTSAAKRPRLDSLCQSDPG